MVKEKEEIKEAKQEVKPTAEMVEVPTQTAVAFKLENDEVINHDRMLLEIYKSVKKIEKSVA